MDSNIVPNNLYCTFLETRGKSVHLQAEMDILMANGLIITKW